jgi:hypothetical protein
MEGNVDGGRALESHQRACAALNTSIMINTISIIVVTINFLASIFSIVIPSVSRNFSSILGVEMLSTTPLTKGRSVTYIYIHGWLF